MRKIILITLFILLMTVTIGCNEKPEEVTIQDLLDGKVEVGTKVRVTGTVIFDNMRDGDEIENEEVDLDLSGPTQVTPLADMEINRSVKTYNELDVTDKKLKEGEEMTVEALYKGQDEDFTIIQVTKVEDK